MPRAPRDPDDDGSLTKDGRIDPKETVVSKRKRRKRRARPEPRPELAAWKATARKRADARPFPPDIMLEPAGMDEEHWTPPHSDDELWRLQLADAFGTRSMSVIWVFVDQLSALLGKNIWDEDAHQWRINEHEFSAALAIINGLRPRNELEAAHAAQMVAVHILTMKVTARAIRYEYDLKTAAAAGKLAQVFTNQRQAFEHLRKPNRTAKQSIRVTKETHHHQHMHWHREGDESDGRPQEPRAATIEGSSTLPGEGKVHRLPLPRTCDAEQEGLPQARRAKSRRQARPG